MAYTKFSYIYMLTLSYVCIRQVRSSIQLDGNGNEP